MADAPAVRHRVELRNERFEIGAGLGSTIGQDFYHAVLVNLRAGYHLTDWLGIGAMAGFNVTPKFQTSFHDRLTGVLNNEKQTDRTPTLGEAQDSMNRIGQVFALQAEVIPFTGKISLFNKLFMNYDFYAFGGPGFINFLADGAACSTAGPSCPVTGMKLGGNFGVGMHSYINEFMAIDLEVRNILLRNNPAGRDTTGDLIANGSDLSWDANYIFSMNLTFFFPRLAVKSQ